MPFKTLLFLLISVIGAAWLTIFIGVNMGLIAVGPLLIGAMALRVWLAKQ